MGIGTRLFRWIRALLGSGSADAARDSGRTSGEASPESGLRVMGPGMTYPWYETVQGDSIEQGDMLFGFDVFVPMTGNQARDDELQGEMRTLDVVVMTQTCDIVQGKVRSLLLCPWWDLWKFIQAAKAKGENWGREQRDALRKGNLPGYHLLNEASQDGIEIGLAVVDFREVYTAPAEQVQRFVGKVGTRLRLCPPYKEHLAQAFARFFMRVGLPVDISSEKLKEPRN
jgi:hypothetical protein